MSIEYLLNTTRTVGDASYANVKEYDAHFESAADGQFFPVGTNDWFMSFRMYWSWKNLSGTTQSASSSGVWTFAFATDVSNRISMRYKAGVDLALSWVQGGTTLASAPITFSNYPGMKNHVGGTIPILIRKTGNTIKNCLLNVEVEGEPYVLASSEATSSGAALNLDTVMGSTGKFLLGSYFEGDATEDHWISDLVIGELNAGQTWSDVEMDTDDQLKVAMIDPHYSLAKHSSKFGQKRSFDAVDAAGDRLLLKRRKEMAATDKLKCIHSGTELSLVGGASTRPILCPPYMLPARTPEIRQSSLAIPKAQAAGNAVVTIGSIANPSSSQEFSLRVFDKNTLLPCKPAIPIVLAFKYLDSSNGGALTEYFSEPSIVEIGDSHTQGSVVLDFATGRVVAQLNHHSNDFANEPQSGDTFLTVGSMFDYRDGQVPVVKSFPYLDTGFVSRDTTTYGLLVSDNSGDVISLSRYGETLTGGMRFNRIKANSTVESVDLTTVPGSVKAGIPSGGVDLGDGYLLFIANTRIDTQEDYWGATAVIVKSDEFLSTTTGWYAARDGSQLAGSKGSVSWGNPSLYPVPSVGRDQLDAFSSVGTPIDPTVLEYSTLVVSDGLVSEVIDGVTYVGMLSRTYTDPMRLDPSTPNIDRYLWDVFTFDPLSPKLTHLHQLDVTGWFQSAASGENVEAPWQPAYDWESTRVFPIMSEGAKIAFATLRSDGEGFTGNAINVNHLSGGTGIGRVSVENWHTQKPVVVADHERFYSMPAGEADYITIRRVYGDKDLVLVEMTPPNSVGTTNLDEAQTLLVDAKVSELKTGSATATEDIATAVRANLDATPIAVADVTLVPDQSGVTDLGGVDVSGSAVPASGDWNTTTPATATQVAAVTTAITAFINAGVTLTPATSNALATAVAAGVQSSFINGTAVTDAIVQAIDDADIAEPSLIAGVRDSLERSGGMLQLMQTVLGLAATQSSVDAVDLKIDGIENDTAEAKTAAEAANNKLTTPRLAKIDGITAGLDAAGIKTAVGELLTGNLNDHVPIPVPNGYDGFWKMVNDARVASESAKTRVETALPDAGPGSEAGLPVKSDLDSAGGGLTAQQEATLNSMASAVDGLDTSLGGGELSPNAKQVWKMRRLPTGVGSSFPITKQPGETLRVYAKMDALLGKNETLGGTNTITVTDEGDSGVTIDSSTIEKNGTWISFEVAGGNDGADTELSISFETSTAKPMEADGPLRIRD